MNVGDVVVHRAHRDMLMVVVSVLDGGNVVCEYHENNEFKKHQFQCTSLEVLEPLEDAEAHRRFMERVGKMTPHQVFLSSVQAGIHYPDGRLCPPYDGSAEREDSAE